MSDDETVVAYEANCIIKEELGKKFRLASFITDDKIKSCDALLQQASDAFFTDALEDLIALEALTAADRFTVMNGDLIAHHIYNIRSLAKVLGFSLITEICVHFINALYSTDLADQKRSLLLSKLVEALRLTFDKRIRDHGDAVGEALLHNLRMKFPGLGT